MATQSKSPHQQRLREAQSDLRESQRQLLQDSRLLESADTKVASYRKKLANFQEAIKIAEAEKAVLVETVPTLRRMVALLQQRKDQLEELIALGG